MMEYKTRNGEYIRVPYVFLVIEWEYDVKKTVEIFPTYEEASDYIERTYEYYIIEKREIKGELCNKDGDCQFCGENGL